MYFQPPAGSGSSTLFQLGAATATAAAGGATETLALAFGVPFTALMHCGELVVLATGTGVQPVAPTAPRNNRVRTAAAQRRASRALRIAGMAEISKSTPTQYRHPSPWKHGTSWQFRLTEA